MLSSTHCCFLELPPAVLSGSGCVSPLGPHAGLLHKASQEVAEGKNGFVLKFEEMKETGDKQDPVPGESRAY